MSDLATVVRMGYGDIGLLQRTGIPFQCDIEFGDINETFKTAWTKLDWYLTNISEDITLNWIRIFPKTPIYEYAIKKGLIQNSEAHIREGCPYVNVSQMTLEEISSINQSIMKSIPFSRYKFEIGEDANIDDTGRLTFQTKCPRCGASYGIRHVSCFTPDDAIKCPICHKRSGTYLTMSMEERFRTNFEWITKKSDKVLLCGITPKSFELFQRLNRDCSDYQDKILYADEGILNLMTKINGKSIHPIQSMIVDKSIDTIVYFSHIPNNMFQNLQMHTLRQHQHIQRFESANNLFRSDYIGKKFYAPNRVFASASVYLTDDCNLSCAYCFNKRHKETPKSMDIRTSERVVSLLFDAAINQRRIGGMQPHVNIMFFGGEPTLNLPTMRHMYDYAIENSRKNGIPFSCTLSTNCTIWNDEYEDFLNHWHNSTRNVRVQLSIDGVPEVMRHDRCSKEFNVDVSEIIVPTAKKYVEWARSKGILEQQSVHGHGTISKFALPYLKKSYDFMRDEIGLPMAWFMLVHEEPWDENDEMIFEEQTRLIAERSFNECVEIGNNGPLSRYPTLQIANERPQRPCAAGETFCSFDPEGRIYPCHQFRARCKENGEMISLGDLDNGIDVDVLKQYSNLGFVNCHADGSCGDCSNYSCKYCFAANFDVNKDMIRGFPNYCKLSKIEHKIRLELNERLVLMGIQKAPIPICAAHCVCVAN